jgi:ribonuclease P protein component
MNLYARRNFLSIKSDLIIKDILKNGDKKYTRFGIFFLAKKKSTQTYYAILIKKNVGNAVKRNYCKRIVREYIRNNISKFGQYNFIIFLYNNRGEIKYNDLKSEFDRKLMLA